MNKKFFLMGGNTGLVLGVALVITLTGCVGYVDGPRAGVYVGPAVVAPDDFVYYPSYGIYYGSISHQYYYSEGGAWVGHPAPIGVSVGALFASPSVNVDFHDNLAAHHAEVARAYPRTWTASGAAPGREKVAARAPAPMAAIVKTSARQEMARKTAPTKATARKEDDRR